MRVPPVAVWLAFTLLPCREILRRPLFDAAGDLDRPRSRTVHTLARTGPRRTRSASPSTPRSPPPRRRDRRARRQDVDMLGRTHPAFAHRVAHEQPHRSSPAPGHAARRGTKVSRLLQHPVFRTHVSTTGFHFCVRQRTPGVRRSAECLPNGGDRLRGDEFHQRPGADQAPCATATGQGPPLIARAVGQGTRSNSRSSLAACFSLTLGRPGGPFDRASISPRSRHWRLHRPLADSQGGNCLPVLLPRPAAGSAPAPLPGGGQPAALRLSHGCRAAETALLERCRHRPLKFRSR